MLARIAQRYFCFAALGAFFLVLGRRLALLKIYGSDLPFHDQWDAVAPT